MPKLRARAAHLDIEIEQGATYVLPITWRADDEPVDLSQAQALFVLVGDGATVLESGAVVALGGAAGTLTVTVPATTTAGLNFTDGAWALEVTLGGVVWRLLQGHATVVPRFPS